MAAEIGTSVKKGQTPDGVIHPIHDERIPAVDVTPASGSTNVITSGGVYNAINNAQVWEAGSGSNSVQTKGSNSTAGGDYSVAEGESTIAKGV